MKKQITFVGCVVGDVDGEVVGEVVGDVVGEVVGEVVGDVMGLVVGGEVGLVSKRQKLQGLWEWLIKEVLWLLRENIFSQFSHRISLLLTLQKRDGEASAVSLRLY